MVRYTAPVFAGSEWIAPVLGTVVFVYGVRLSSEVIHRTAGPPWGWMPRPDRHGDHGGLSGFAGYHSGCSTSTSGGARRPLITIMLLRARMDRAIGERLGLVNCSTRDVPAEVEPETVPLDRQQDLVPDHP